MLRGRRLRVQQRSADPVTDDDGEAALAAIGNGTSGWSTGDGGDAPEGQLYALQQLTDATKAGWRSDSSRILVWFGDNPGHDPVCAAISGDETDVTHQTVSQALRDANVRIIAVCLDTDGDGPNSTGLNGNLSADSDVDYDAACGDSPPSTPQQANSFANATGGVVKNAASAEEVSDEILAGLTNLPATVTPEADCDAGLSISFDPSEKTVTSGDDADVHGNVELSPTATTRRHPRVHHHLPHQRLVVTARRRRDSRSRLQADDLRSRSTLGRRRS